jgi:hypothetical protein
MKNNFNKKRARFLKTHENLEKHKCSRIFVMKSHTRLVFKTKRLAMPFNISKMHFLSINNKSKLS